MNTDSENIRLVVDLFGIVQAVGFRPALHQLATRANLGGWVQNRSDRVRLSLDGSSPKLDKFIDDLPNGIPELARLDRIEVVSRKTIKTIDVAQTFHIIASTTSDQAELAIPADLAMCDACLEEILDPTHRRYGYAFTTCTRCGPRYTVINSMPYDRERTTLADFPLCDACLNEYQDPANRRFHAESTACPICGPNLLLDDNGFQLTGTEALQQARKKLHNGAIVAVRGIGGFLLAADAANRTALATLRKRKHRPDKPFAVMAANIETLHRICHVPDDASRLLQSPQRPIVILDLKHDAANHLPIDQLTPDAQTLGAMLPTSPLHQLLLTPLTNDPTPPFSFLVMTSGNRGGEPICISDDEAHDRLCDIADVILSHNREINLRNDDSLCIMRGNTPQVWRRARGYAPEPIHLKQPLGHRVLAMGAELKNTIAIGRNDHVVLSPHIGDLDTLEAVESQKNIARCLPEFLNCIPERIAVDLHPDMHSTRLGHKLSMQMGIPTVEVQHHHAHAAACMAEHDCQDALALIFDGTGLGTDETIWGAELLHVTRSSYKRCATFKPAHLPGGDAAVTQPARQLIARWLAAGVDITENHAQQFGVTPGEINVWSQQMSRNINTPLSRSAGRLFDAFSVALGIAPSRTSYDGQPAIRLESEAARCRTTSDLPEIPYDSVETNGLLQIDWQNAFVRLQDVRVAPDNRSEWALAVHYAIANAACEMIEFAASGSGCRTVVLSGGVFMNRILADRVAQQVRSTGLIVLEHQLVPPNDGGISLGQAVIAGR